MTRKRKIEILEKAKKKLRCGRHTGLCGVAMGLFLYKEINHPEYIWIGDVIGKYKPKSEKYFPFYYPSYSIPPRIRLLNRIIKDLKNGVKK